ncbi:hypothetical protein BDV95DRAFT_484771 [Massariosphaeria phaeospora]|uniref:AB hydrolase-1 domain-containing protein n=1 Tax=Massariosphaeria phaeospora TaxID=100035 RepID=A0A7C8IBN2_9PLEO|nr:hypothetical protein BDV95DRAFT_484771 [Massariosphaeria phaeospora]
MASQDPRSSSTQSLVPDPALENTGRRRLLLVYIHGFMGNETSFRNFPAHVHNLVTITLSDSHSVHTKIYPRYRSRHALTVARDSFSEWLTPHETPWTDVILLGHSMGGLLAADIALTFRHRILGVVNFDVPFIGMHPGIVKAGLGSIFKPWPAPVDQSIDETAQTPGPKPSRMSTLFSKPSDPNYNPSFHNDVNLPVRKGWENTLHFINKHSSGLIQASKGLIASHLEFGGAMADYRTLTDRYARVRALEEDDEATRRSANPGARTPPRIRFVNYYTASTGRPKKPKSPKSPSPSRRPSQEIIHQNSNASNVGTPSHLTLNTKPPSVGTTSPRISVEEHRDDEVVPVSPEEPLSATSPVPMSDSSTESLPLEPDSAPDLPEIPPIPQEPAFVDLALYPNKVERKAAEKDHDRALKDYQREVKARNKVIKERSKLEEKWEKLKRQKQKDADKQKREGQAKDDAATLKETDKQRREEQDQDHAATLEEAQANTEHNTGHDADALAQSVGGMHIDASAHDTRSTHPYAHYDFSRSAILNQPPPDDYASRSGSMSPSSYADSAYTLTTMDSHRTHHSNPDAANAPDAAPKKQRLRKFCMLPPKDDSGNKDPTWVRVFMEGIDEVTAHTTLFFMSETYQRLVGDVAARIEEWVREADSLRLVRDMEGLE